jgi:hypothetical protein
LESREAERRDAQRKLDELGRSIREVREALNRRPVDGR